MFKTFYNTAKFNTYKKHKILLSTGLALLMGQVSDESTSLTVQHTHIRGLRCTYCSRGTLVFFSNLRIVFEELTCLGGSYNTILLM